MNEVKINFDEYWCRPYAEYSHWALIDESESGECTVYFIYTPPSEEVIKFIRLKHPRYQPPFDSPAGIFDEMDFPNVAEAKAAIKRNRFILNSERTEGNSGVRIPPKPPFYRIEYLLASGYSTGMLVWIDKDNTRRSTEISRALEPKGCLVVLFLVITSLCVFGVGLFHIC